MTERYKDRNTDIQKGRKTERQRDKKTERQKDRKTEKTDVPKGFLYSRLSKATLNVVQN